MDSNPRLSRSLRATVFALRLARYLTLVVGALFAVVLAITISKSADITRELALEREISDPQQALVAAATALLLAITGCAAFWAVVTKLLRIMEALRNGDLFAPESVQHLRSIGAALTAFLIIYASSKAVVQAAVPSSHGIDWLALLPGFGAVLLIFVLAEVFAEGARMREELEGTV